MANSRSCCCGIVDVHAKYSHNRFARVLRTTVSTWRKLLAPNDAPWRNIHLFMSTRFCWKFMRRWGSEVDFFLGADRLNSWGRVKEWYLIHFGSSSFSHFFLILEIPRKLFLPCSTVQIKFSNFLHCAPPPPLFPPSSFRLWQFVPAKESYWVFLHWSLNLLS